MHHIKLCETCKYSQNPQVSFQVCDFLQNINHIKMCRHNYCFRDHFPCHGIVVSCSNAHSGDSCMWTTLWVACQNGRIDTRYYFVFIVPPVVCGCLLRTLNRNQDSSAVLAGFLTTSDARRRSLFHLTNKWRPDKWVYCVRRISQYTCAEILHNKCDTNKNGANTLLHCVSYWVQKCQSRTWNGYQF